MLLQLSRTTLAKFANYQNKSQVTAAKFKPISHLIFDLDGVLLDTESLYTKAIQNVVGRYGKTFTWDLKVKTMGFRLMEAAKLMVDELNLPITWEEYAAIIKEEYKTVMVNPDVFPAAGKLVRHLARSRIPMAVATSSSQYSFNIKTANHKEFFKLFDHIVFGSDPEIKRGKPAPDIFLVTASKFPSKPHPKKCLVIEDAPNGVQAALNAGMQVVMVPDERVPMELRNGATLVVTSLEYVPLEKFGLPPLK